MNDKLKTRFGMSLAYMVGCPRLFDTITFCTLKGRFCTLQGALLIDSGLKYSP